MTDETYRGTVKRVFFDNPETPAFAGVLDSDDGQSIRFLAKSWAKVGDKVELTGTWTEHPKYGAQFNAHTGIVTMDESPEAMATLLATHESFKGLGPARAKKVVKEAMRLSETGQAIDGLLEFPDEVAIAAGVPLDVVSNAAKIWSGDKERFHALSLLAEQGWTSGQGIKIVAKLGNNAPALVKDDPYFLIGKIERFGFRVVDAVARKLGFNSTHPYRLAAGIAYCLDRISSDGNTITERGALIERAVEELRPDTLDGEDRIRDTLDQMIAQGLVFVDRSPTDKEFVANAHLARTEMRVFERLLDGLSDTNVLPMNFDGERAKTIIPTLDNDQEEALHSSCQRRFSAVFGGAGVGKTYLMRAICEIAEENGLTVALCAPTGKAARKLSHATGRPAMTIHRLLSPFYEDGVFKFLHNEANPIEADLIVCDEFSMVDVRLLNSLLDAIEPPTPISSDSNEEPHPGCRLLIVGDHNQIPSVGPGAVLRDILSGRSKYPGAVNVLNKIHRQAGILARNVTAIVDGVVVREENPAWNFLNFSKGYETSAAKEVVMNIEAIVTSPEPLEPFGRQLDFAWDIQVLSPMRKGPLGTWALNVELQKLRQRLLGNKPPEPTAEDSAPQPMVGDRVLWTKNNYTLELFNGTQAIVTKLLKGGGYEIFTEDKRLVEIPNSERNNLEVAYAMTVHKSQGSEWPMVIAICSSKHWHMHDRNLLYTGASRASKSLMLVGDKSGLQHFAKEQKSYRRKTIGGYMVHGWKSSNHYR